MSKKEIKNRMKYLARKFCKRNNVYLEFDSSVGKLVEKSYLSAYLLCLHESKNKIVGLEAQIGKMKCLLNEIYSEFGFSELVKIRNDLPLEIQDVIKEINENGKN